MFSWDDLRVFLAVARTGSTLGAGRRLKVSQTTPPGASPPWKQRSA